jgi:hypothetical protein
MSAYLPAPAWMARREERLRLRRLRRLQRPLERRPRAQLPRPRLPRRRLRNHDHRRPRDRRRAPPCAARLPAGARLPVRLLHPRHDHHRLQSQPGPAQRSRRSAQGQLVPLHRLSRHRRCDPRRASRRRDRPRGAVRPQRPGARRPRRRDREGPLHVRHRRRGAAPSQAVALAPRPRPHPFDPHGGGARRSRCRVGAHLERHAGPPVLHRASRARSRRPRRHHDPRRCRAFCRSARRRRHRRQRECCRGRLPAAGGRL